MATAFTHAFVALAAAGVCFRRPLPWTFWVAAPLCSAAPDLDVLLHSFGVGYGGLWGHRGLTHSLPFALVLSVGLVSTLFRREAPFPSRPWAQLVGFFFLVTASHGFLDAFTDGGHGIAFFAPFDATRHFMPWNPLHVPPIGISRFFTDHGARAFLSELLWVWLPVSCLVGLILAVRTHALSNQRSRRRID